MAESQPSPESQFSEFVSRFPAEIVTLVKQCMPKLRHFLPGTNELVYVYNHSVVVSFTMSEYGKDGIVAIAILATGVKLYFDKSLPDPKGLLEGKGGKVRSVNVKAASELDRGDIHELIKAAISKSGVNFPRTGSTTMIIQSEGKKESSKAKPKKPSSKAAPKNAKPTAAKPKLKKSGKA